MRSDHIRFWELESDDQLDEQHLAECAECRRQLAIARFLHLQLANVARVEAPAFFVARLQALARNEGKSTLIYYFEHIAAQLVPLLTVLILATTFLVYTVGRQQEYSPSAALETAAYPEVSVDSLITPALDLDEGSTK